MRRNVEHESARAHGRHPACPAFGACGACQTLDVPYEQQLIAKQRAIGDLFPDAARADAIRPILGMEDPAHYRNKVVAPYVAAPARRGVQASRGAEVRERDRRCARGAARRREQVPCKGQKGGGSRRGTVLTGMYAKGTHEVIPTEGCVLENVEAKAATLAVRDLMEKWSIPPYDEDAHTGFIRHVVARAGRTGEVLVTIVTNGDAFPSSKSFCRELVRRVPSVVTVVQSVNERQTNVILGERERTLYGPGFILDELCGLRFRISSGSFYQVNAVQAEVLYEAAIALAGAGPEDVVVDAYCGTGTIGLVAAKRGAGRVIGVEAVESAVADARQNARHNGVEAAEFVCADATGFMQDMARDDRLAVRSGKLVLMMDPPRAGASPEFLDAACALRPDRIVYISCDPRTQARDVARLVEGGYRVAVVQPVDMFPHTDHIENIILLEQMFYGFHEDDG